MKLVRKANDFFYYSILRFSRQRPVVYFPLDRYRIVLSSAASRYVRKNREITRMELKRVARTQKERRTVALVPRTTTVLPLVHSNRVTIIKLAKLVLAPREYSWRDVPARANQYLLRDKEIRGTCFSNYPSCVILRWITSINEQYVFGVSLFLTRCIHFSLVCKHLAFDMVGSEVRTWKKRKI